MDKQLMLFEGREVIILFAEDVDFKFEGNFIIGAKDLALSLEYQGESATNHVLKFCKEKHIYHVKNSDILNRNVRKLNNAGEKFISNLSLNRVLGQSGQPKAEPFQDWLYEDILPSVQKTGKYELPDKIEPEMLQFKKEVYMLQSTFEILQVNEGSKIKMLGDFNKSHGFAITLPAYTEEELTKSATFLLGKHGVEVSAKAFNESLVNLGYLEEKTRPSSKGGFKTFKSLTGMGLEYGKNLISPANQKETQPHYFESKFSDLLIQTGLITK